MAWPAIQHVRQGVDGREMNAVKPVIRNAATLILVAKNSHLKSYFDYRILLLERGTKSKFMVGTARYVLQVGVSLLSLCTCQC